jgi:hypothetical protein
LQKAKAEQATSAAENALALVPNRVAILADTSSSMDATWFSTTRIGAVKRSIEAIILASNAKETNYSLITFNNAAHVVFKMGTPFAKFMAVEFFPTGSTTAAGAFDMGIKQNANRIIFLTDGAVFDSSQCIFLAKEFCLNRIKVDCIAIGEAYDTFLRELCEITGGVFRRAENPDQLEQIFIDLEPRNYLLLEEHKS